MMHLLKKEKPRFQGERPGRETIFFPIARRKKLDLYFTPKIHLRDVRSVTFRTITRTKKEGFELLGVKARMKSNRSTKVYEQIQPAR